CEKERRGGADVAMRALHRASEQGFGFICVGNLGKDYVELRMVSVVSRENSQGLLAAGGGSDIRVAAITGVGDRDEMVKSAEADERAAVLLFEPQKLVVHRVRGMTLAIDSVAFLWGLSV